VFSLDVSDNLKVAKVEVTRDIPGEMPVILTTAPFAFGWTWGCGTSTIHIRVIDAAGGEAATTAKVTSTDQADFDCDGFRPISAGGLDCDDHNAAVHPGAPEIPEGFDLNCDGQVASLDGVDSDGDGVPSLADGGNDCDDTNPAIHGDYYQFAHAALRVGGVPVTWNPGDAVVQTGTGFWELYLNRAGVVERYTRGFTDDAVVEQIATGANPSSLSVRNGYVAFGRGNDIVIVNRSTGQWVEQGVIHAGGPVGKLAVNRFVGPGNSPYAAFQTGTDIWLATSVDGSSWTIEHIADLGEPLVESPSGYADSTSAAFAFHTSHGVSTYSRYQGGAFQATRAGPQNKTPTAMTAAISPTGVLVAVNDGSGSAIYSGGGSQPVLRTSKRVTAMSARYPSVFLQLDDGSLEVFAVSARSAVLRHAQTIADVGTFDTADHDGFAGSGVVYYLAGSSIFAPSDPRDDHIDRDCDERD
jgi:hypothetical protein